MGGASAAMGVDYFITAGGHMYEEEALFKQDVRKWNCKHKKHT